MPELAEPLPQPQPENRIASATRPEAVASALKGRLTFLLVHGAWHGGWCWYHVAERLRSLGHIVLTPTLTGLGERAHLVSREINLTTHIQDIIGVIDFEGLTDIVCVGHSYGGMVITGVADKRPDSLRSMIYLDAYVPQSGQALLDLAPQDLTEQVTEDMLDGYLIPALPIPMFGVPESEGELTSWMTQRLTAHPVGTMVDPVHLQNKRTEEYQKVFVHCTDSAIDVGADRTKSLAADKTDWLWREMATGHNPMMTHPADLSELLVELA